MAVDREAPFSTEQNLPSVLSSGENPSDESKILLCILPVHRTPYVQQEVDVQAFYRTSSGNLKDRFWDFRDAVDAATEIAVGIVEISVAAVSYQARRSQIAKFYRWSKNNLL